VRLKERLGMGRTVHVADRRTDEVVPTVRDGRQRGLWIVVILHAGVLRRARCAFGCPRCGMGGWRA